MFPRLTVWACLLLFALGMAQAHETAQPSPHSTVPRPDDGTPAVSIHGERKQWHTITLDLAGPYAHERDLQPNAFTDYAFEVTFTPAQGGRSYRVPGFFAADGNAAETGAEGGTVWRAHFSPDQSGTWNYAFTFLHGPNVATYGGGAPLAPYHGVAGSFEIGPTDKTAPDFRARGRLAYVGERYLRFLGDGSTFLKVGTDSPETYLACADFDNTIAPKADVPLKTWAPHVRDWRTGDPVWRNDRGKGIIGSINYLSSKGVNSFSFLTYNAGGDGDNIWPFVERNDKLRYDVSKLAQWEIVFAHAQQMGLHLHFKLQENENDDHRAKAARTPHIIPEAMDAGKTGPERRLYFREMIARFGHHLALNWNFGEENTQSYEEQVAMLDYVASLDPYDHPRVIHTFPEQQDHVYSNLLGTRSQLTGTSLQNPWRNTHARTLHWVWASTAEGRPWVVANDEQNPAGLGVPPDPDYDAFGQRAAGKDLPYDLHDIRKHALWGNLMAGGAGVEYYFGYRLPQNDLLCEDLRSRDRSWNYGRIALQFFRSLTVDVSQLQPADALVHHASAPADAWCLAAPGKLYVVYFLQGGAATLDLTHHPGDYALAWFDPRTGQTSSAGHLEGGERVSLPTAPSSDDWALTVTRSAP